MDERAGNARAKRLAMAIEREAKSLGCDDAELLAACSVVMGGAAVAIGLSGPQLLERVYAVYTALRGFTAPRPEGDALH